MAKLVKESLDEISQEEKDIAIKYIEKVRKENPWADQFFEEYPEAIEDYIEEGSVSSGDLASFVDDVWEDMTGLSVREKDAEQFFPGEVEELTDALLSDPSDFDYAWGSQREGADDYEVYCDECGEELDYEGMCPECDEDEDEDEDY